MVDENEQWLLHGNCKLCRRASYCSKPCKVAKERSDAELNAVMWEVLGETPVGKAFTTLYDSVYGKGNWDI